MGIFAIEVEDIYEHIQNILDNFKSHYKLAMGYFKAKVGTKRSSNKQVRNFAFGKRQQRRTRRVKRDK